MTRKLTALAILAALQTVAGCRAEPTRVEKFPGPSSEVFYTAEVWEESGAISSDFTRVSANFRHNGQTDKQTFLDGPYLKVAAVRWIGENDATVCISEGRVNSFKDRIILHAGGASYAIRNAVEHFCPG